GGITRNDCFAFRRELARDGGRALLVGGHALLVGAGGRGSSDTRPGNGGGQQNDQDAGERPPPASPTGGRTLAGIEEVTFGLAERQIAGRVGGGPGRGSGGGLQQAAAVEVRRVAGLAFPFGGDVVQPGADDPVGVGFGQPGVA